jgi:Flp pilus assembly protein CpaB
LKRSNRLVLLVGVFLAIVAFVGILLLARGGANDTPPVATTGNVVVAAVDIPLSGKIQASDVTTKVVELTAISAGAFTDVSQVLGQIVRQPVAAGAQITADTLTGGQAGQVLNIDCPVGLRCMSIQVDQTTGVGTVIKTGDYVDMVIGLTGSDKFPVITVNPADDSVTVVNGLNSTSVKLVLQGLQVMGTLLPPTPDTTGQTENGGATPDNGTALNGQQEIVIVAVDAQQAEVIKFAQIDASISLVLRSPEDFIDPITKQPIKPLPNETTGIILKSLVDSYGILPPEVVETVTPAAK